MDIGNRRGWNSTWAQQNGRSYSQCFFPRSVPIFPLIPLPFADAAVIVVVNDALPQFKIVFDKVALFFYRSHFLKDQDAALLAARPELAPPRQSATAPSLQSDSSSILVKSLSSPQISQTAQNSPANSHSEISAPNQSHESPTLGTSRC